VRPGRATGGFGYWVSDEQLRAYAHLTPLQRLQWLDEARRFLPLALSPEARERQGRLRRGRDDYGRLKRFSVPACCRSSPA
jgi:hypothetical protein